MNSTQMTQVMKRTFSICLIALGLFAGFALYSKGRGIKANAMMATPRALAAPVVTYNFTGYITYDRDGSISYPAGTEVTGTFSYDAGNPNIQYLADGVSAVYLGSAQYPMSMSIRVGTTETWTSSDCHISLTNTSGNDLFTMIGHTSEGDDVYLKLRGPMFNSLALPTTLTGATDKDFYINDFPVGGGAMRVLGGNIDYLLPPVAQPPAITVTSLTRTAGVPASPAQIATVSDVEDAPGSLVVTVNNTTVNGVSLSGLSVNSLGQVTANVGAACTASNASFTLRVTDSGGLFAEAPLNITVAANPAPSLGNYPNATVSVNGNTTVTPASPPADNVSVNSVTLMTPGFTGTATVNAATGTVSISNAGSAGSFLFTVTATDNCGAQVARTFTLSVAADTCGITVNPATLSQPYVAVPYVKVLSASPSGNYTFSVSAGALPPGLELVTALGSTSIAGLPTTPGIYSFTIKTIKNGTTCEATRSYTVTIPTTVVPILECVQRNQNGSWTARFGYDNSTGAAVTIPVGSNNFFLPGNQNRGQTTVFQPGRVINAFSATFNANGSNLGFWFLKGPDGVLRPVNVLTTSIGCP